MRTGFCRSFGIIILATSSQTALAERIHAYWRLDPTSPLPTTATFKQPFLEFSLEPVHLVKTTSPSDLPGIPIGTPLYLVFNDDGQIGYCPRPSAKQHSAAWLTGLATRRPCLMDSNSDGKFDKSFTVYDVTDTLNKVPASFGSIQSAVPLSTQVSFADAEASDIRIPVPYRFVFSGEHELGKSILEFRTANGPLDYVRPVRGTSPPVYVALNYAIEIKSITGDQAEIVVLENPNLYVSWAGTSIAAKPLPAQVQAYVDGRKRASK